jgi:hypothetical protein
MIMKKFILVFIIVLAYEIHAQKADNRYFEMRTYTCPEGKRPELIKRFQDHTLNLFKKNGIESIAYFLPVDESNYTLTFIIAYPDQASRDKLWNQFFNSPEWQKAYKESEVNGPLVSNVQQVFMTMAPELSSGIPNLKSEDRIFEMRTYYMHQGRVEAINARFRDHTRTLFEKHGMTNVVYWYTVESDGSQPKLVYLLAHKSVEAAKASFDAFGKDPAWIKVRDESQASGPIVEKIVSVYFKALPFSPMQ